MNRPQTVPIPPAAFSRLGKALASNPPRSVRYQIEECIGQGGLGEVFRAWDTQLNRRVALKRIYLQDSIPEEIYVKAMREATHLAALQHPNIVSVYDLGQDQAGPFVVMELVDGETLETVVERGAFPLPDFRLFAQQSLDALAAAHHVGLLHRDLKPSNVMLKWGITSSFEVKILDFGLAKFVTRTPTPAIDARESTVLGSIYFMAPEQFERHTVDVRTDLYALGCVFYYSLAAFYPFQGETVGAVITNHLDHRVPPLEPLRPDVPGPVCQWIARLMSRWPQERPETTVQAIEEFARLWMILPGPARLALPPTEPLLPATAGGGAEPAAAGPTARTAAARSSGTRHRTDCRSERAWPAGAEAAGEGFPSAQPAVAWLRRRYDWKDGLLFGVVALFSALVGALGRALFH